MRSITLFALFCARLAAADMRPEWTVLYGHEEFRKTDTMLQDYLSKAHSAAEADREKVIASVRTPVALRKYQSEPAARLRAILGEFPARTPLNPKDAVSAQATRSRSSFLKAVRVTTSPRTSTCHAVGLACSREGFVPSATGA